jgi:hypothetical protein
LQVRVTRAYEGLELPSTEDNIDTDCLALHSLENLPGWSGQLRLEMRHYSPDGRLIDSLGSADASLRKILVLGEDGAYQPFDQDGEELSGSTTFFNSLLQALPDSERMALNVQIGDEARLKQLIRQHPLSREALRTLLGRQVNLKPAYDPKVMRLLGGGDGYRLLPTRTPTLQARVQSLFPQLSAEELDAFVERLQQHPTGPRAELNRLMVEHSGLYDTLSPWCNDIPQYLPDTQTRLTPEQLTTQMQARRQFMIDLMECWRRQWVPTQTGFATTDFNFFQPIIGELPALSADFSRVQTLTMDGCSAARVRRRFCAVLPDCTLKLRYFNLGHLPDVVAQLQLDELILSDCAISLSPEAHATLAAQDQMTILDMYNNPLGLVPDVGGMPKLNYIDLSHTGISELPKDLLTRPRLSTALLNDNRIEELPTALFSLPPDSQEGFDLGNNPLSSATRERLKQHYLATRQDFGIYAEASDLRRAQALYPMMDQEEASKFVNSLPGTLDEGEPN